MSTASSLLQAFEMSNNIHPIPARLLSLWRTITSVSLNEEALVRTESFEENPELIVCFFFLVGVASFLRGQSLEDYARYVARKG
jgi:hypothetical protein